MGEYALEWIGSGQGGYSQFFVDGFFTAMEKHGLEEACGMISAQGRDMLLDHHGGRLSQEQIIYIKMLDM